MTDIPPGQPKYERLWQIADRFFDDDCEDARKLAKEVGSIDAALERRARVDRALERLEAEDQRRTERKFYRQDVAWIIAKTGGIAMFVVLIANGIRTLGQWYGWWQ